MNTYRVWIDGCAVNNSIETDFGIIDAASMDEALDKSAQIAGYIDHANIAQELNWEDSQFNIVEISFKGDNEDEN